MYLSLYPFDLRKRSNLLVAFKHVSSGRSFLSLSRGSFRVILSSDSYIAVTEYRADTWFEWRTVSWGKNSNSSKWLCKSFRKSARGKWSFAYGMSGNEIKFSSFRVSWQGKNNGNSTANAYAKSAGLKINSQQTEKYLKLPSLSCGSCFRFFFLC